MNLGLQRCRQLLYRLSHQGNDGWHILPAIILSFLPLPHISHRGLLLDVFRHGRAFLPLSGIALGSQSLTLSAPQLLYRLIPIIR